MQKLSTPQLLVERASLLSLVRTFFHQKLVLEVDTPLLDHYTVTDPYMSALQVFNNKKQSFGYLQTSPEYSMKRLLAEGSGDIYQLSKMFRADESGQYHSSEFTMIEWYRIGFSLDDLIQEVYQLISEAIGERPFEHYTYRQAFVQWAGLDPLKDSNETIKAFAESNLGDIPKDLLRDNYLSLLFSEIVEPKFNPKSITVISHYPASQASLAKLVEKDGFQVGERFEVYANGLELANGFHELTDPQEQLNRFKQDNLTRQQLNLLEIEIDYRLVEALEQGLPDCSGVALGFDRLLMIKLEQDHIDQILPI